MEKIKTVAHYYNNFDEEVAKELATHMVVLTYDEKGNVIESVYSYFDNYIPSVIGVQLPTAKKHND